MAAAADTPKPQQSGRASQFSTARMIVLVIVLAVGVALAFAGFGYGLAQRADARHAAEQRAALRGAIAEFRALFRDVGEMDPRFVRMVRQSVRLKTLQFETAPPAEGREMQPVINDDGRIIGFFTWQPARPMADAVNRLLPWLALAGAGFLSFCGFSFLQLQRARRQIAESEAQARKAANEDRLTGLPNHARLVELLGEAMREREGARTVKFAVIKLDGTDDAVAQTNARDELIVATAGRLKDALPAEAIYGRFAPEKFAVILNGSSDAEAQQILRDTIAAVSRSHWIGTAVRIGAHAGIAEAPRDAETADELVRHADFALRAAAKKGPGAIAAYEKTAHAADGEQEFIRRELPRALDAKALDLHYQPIVAASGGRIVGVEALLRWTHPARGPIPPATFIPVAEQMGLMDALGAFVLRRAATEAKRWPGIYMAVNLSPLQVRDRAIVDLVRDTLAETGLAPSRLMLEITEGVLIDNPDEMVKRIQDLRALGVRIALDDFGSGYSNLGYLQKFPFDKLKIDRSFVTALGRTSNGSVIIQAIVALGRALGVTVLVEGVETEEQRVLLRLAGCDEMQGFLFARPGPREAVERLLKEIDANEKTKPAVRTGYAIAGS